MGGSLYVESMRQVNEDKSYRKQTYTTENTYFQIKSYTCNLPKHKIIHILY